MIEYADPEPLRCSACGGSDYLRPYSPWHSIPICRPCFFVWYDSPEPVDSTSPADVGRVSRKLKAVGKYPWDDETLKRLKKS